MCRVGNLWVVGVFAVLLSPAAARAQAILALRLPVFGYGGFPGMSGVFGSAYGSGYGYGRGLFGYGNRSNAALLALYNSPLRHNAAFMPAPYNPTPSVYNPMLYNASFNPALAAHAASYLAAGKDKKDAQLAARPTDKAIRPASLTRSAEPARLHITVPADATVTLQGVTMKQTGAQRLFITTPLEPDSKYSYDLRVRWQEGGESKSIQRKLSVQAGQDVTLDLRQGR